MFKFKLVGEADLSLEAVIEVEHYDQASVAAKRALTKLLLSHGFHNKNIVGVYVYNITEIM